MSIHDLDTLLSGRTQGEPPSLLSQAGKIAKHVLDLGIVEAGGLSLLLLVYLVP